MVVADEVRTLLKENEQLQRLNGALAEELAQRIDQSDEDLDTVDSLRAEIEDLERLLEMFKIFENGIIENDLLDTILEDGTRVSIGTYWRDYRGEKDPRQLWEIE
jgi:hypothetical protein